MHFGLSEVLAAQGVLDLDAVIEHFCTVNEVSRAVFNAHRTQVIVKWWERSQYEWQTDFGKWAHLLKPKG